METPKPNLARICQWMEFEEEPPVNHPDLKAWLSNRIAWMLENQSEKLMQALYRLDVSETKVMALLSNNAPETWAVGLAQLVLDREVERAYWRSKYGTTEI